MPKTPLDNDAPLTRGDRVEMHFRSVGMAYIKAYQIDLLEQRLENEDEFRVKSIQTPPDQPRNLIIVVEVLGGKRPAGQTPGASGSWEYDPGYGPVGLEPAAIAPVAVPLLLSLGKMAGIVVMAAGLGIIFSLSFKEGFLLFGEAVKTMAETGKEVVESPVGKVAVAGTGVGIAAIGILALLSFAKK